jgi:hypothetical protein
VTHPAAAHRRTGMQLAVYSKGPFLKNTGRRVAKPSVGPAEVLLGNDTQMEGPQRHLSGGSRVEVLFLRATALEVLDQKVTYPGNEAATSV